jgi:hypothetical protein
MRQPANIELKEFFQARAEKYDWSNLTLNETGDLARLFYGYKGEIGDKAKALLEYLVEHIREFSSFGIIKVETLTRLYEQLQALEADLSDCQFPTSGKMKNKNDDEEVVNVKGTILQAYLSLITTRCIPMLSSENLPFYAALNQNLIQIATSCYIHHDSLAVCVEKLKPGLQKRSKGAGYSINSVESNMKSDALGKQLLNNPLLLDSVLASIGTFITGQNVRENANLMAYLLVATATLHSSAKLEFKQCQEVGKYLLTLKGQFPEMTEQIQRKFIDVLPVLVKQIIERKGGKANLTVEEKGVVEAIEDICRDGVRPVPKGFKPKG